MKKSIDIELVLMVAISIAIVLTAAIGFGDATGLYAEDLGDEERIYQVAEQVGCSNARYFGQAFKKYTGQTPTAYIRQYKN